MIGRTNTGGGGGGGLSPNSAVIHVTAPVGSTISFAKGGVVAKVFGPDKSHVNSADASLADWYYSVSQNNYGTWTVTATLGTDTASDTVTIDSNEQYDLMLSFLVPGAYQAVEYLQGTGTQYLATNFLTPNNFGFEIEAALTITTGTSGGGYYNVFGGMNNNSNGIYFMTSNPGFYYKFNSRVTFNGDSSKHKYWWKYNGSSYSYGTDETQIGTVSDEPTVGARFAIFSFTDANGTTRNSDVLKGSIYSLKCFSGETLTAYFVPCYRKSDSVAGMWDNVSETFYTNVGSGTFTVGPDV